MRGARWLWLRQSRNEALGVTSMYAVVILSMLVQGLTIRRLVHPHNQGTTPA